MFNYLIAGILVSVLTITGCIGQDANGVVPAEFNSEYAKGKINNVFSANDDKVLVWADKLYQYNLQNGKITAETSINDRKEINCIAIQNGYAVFGREQGAGNKGPVYSCSIYDESLKEVEKIPLNKIINNDLLISTDLAAITEDGKKLAVSGMGGLYIYDRKAAKTTEIIDFDSDNAVGRKGIVTIEKIDFMDNGRKIAFKAQSFDVPAKADSVSFDTYGWINIDGTELVNHKITNYSAKEMTAYNDFLLLAEDFTTNTGKLMIMDVPSGSQKVITLSTKKESGTVYGSDKGAYFATATLDDSLNIKIYSTPSGKLIKEKVIKVKDPLYVARIPEVIISDDLRTCIVLLGSRQDTLDTMVESFDF